MTSIPLFGTKCIDRIKSRRTTGRIDAEEDSYEDGDSHYHSHIRGVNHCLDLRKLTEYGTEDEAQYHAYESREERYHGGFYKKLK